MKFTIELTWKDESETMFNVEINGKEHEVMAVLMWVTRGSLMETNAQSATAYDEEGFDVVSYIK